MTDWLGMLAAPRNPRPDLKGRVLARALAPRRRWGGPLAAAALITLAVGGGRCVVGLPHHRRAHRQRAVLAARVQALEDTVATFHSRTATRLIQIPVSTGGRSVGDDLRRQRTAPLAGALRRARPERARSGVPAGSSPSGHVHGGGDAHGRGPPMVMALEMPPGGVLGAAMSIEPRAGSASPSGPMVFHRAA